MRNSIIYSLHLMFLRAIGRVEIKVMGGTCNTHGINEKCI